MHVRSQPPYRPIHLSTRPKVSVFDEHEACRAFNRPYSCSVHSLYSPLMLEVRHLTSATATPRVHHRTKHINLYGIWWLQPPGPTSRPSHGMPASLLAVCKRKKRFKRAPRRERRKPVSKGASDQWETRRSPKQMPLRRSSMLHMSYSIQSEGAHGDFSLSV